MDAILTKNNYLPIETQASLWTIVANGRCLQCLGVSRGKSVSLVGHCFCVDFFVIPLKGFGAVLGLNWLHNLRPIQRDFSRMSMVFVRNGRRLELQGTTSDHSLPAPHLSATHILDTTVDKLHQLLDGYSAIFLEPTGLPPRGISVIAISWRNGQIRWWFAPTGIPKRKKNEIERQCADMLQKVFIRQSNSSFSSPVILDKKSMILGSSVLIIRL